MNRGDSADLDRQLDRLAQRLPAGFVHCLNWLRRPRKRWLRWLIGLGLIAGGILSFLPVLGVWMLPLGMVVLAQDAPWLRRPTARLLAWIEDRFART